MQPSDKTLDDCIARALRSTTDLPSPAQKARAWEVLKRRLETVADADEMPVPQSFSAHTSALPVQTFDAVVRIAVEGGKWGMMMGVWMWRMIACTVTAICLDETEPTRRVAYPGFYGVSPSFSQTNHFLLNPMSSFV